MTGETTCDHLTFAFSCEFCGLRLFRANSPLTQKGLGILYQTYRDHMRGYHGTICPNCGKAFGSHLLLGIHARDDCPMMPR